MPSPLKTGTIDPPELEDLGYETLTGRGAQNLRRLAGIYTRVSAAPARKGVLCCESLDYLSFATIQFL